MVSVDGDSIPIEVVVEMRGGPDDGKCLELCDAVTLFSLVQGPASTGNWMEFIVLLRLAHNCSKA